MRIGIDVRPLQGETKFRGIGKALQQFLAKLAVLPKKDLTYVFYIDARHPAPEELLAFPDSLQIIVPASRIGHMRYIRAVLSAYRAIRPNKKDIDVLLQYDASLGIPVSVPCVAVFHDLIPLLFKATPSQKKLPISDKLKGSLARTLHWKKYLRSLKNYERAFHVIAISESSKHDLLTYLPAIPSEKISVIYHGAGQPLNKGAVSSKLKTYTTKPYLLYVGGIDLRKNVVGLLKDFYEIKEDHPDLRLITVGKEFGLKNELADFGWDTVLHSNPSYAKDVISPGFVSDADISYLYEHAAAFVFPSRYEGFGLPILEAMQAGCPTIAYNNSSIPEVAGDAATLVTDGESLVPAIRKVLTDDTLRNELIHKGRLQAKNFTWDKTVDQTIEVLCRVAR